MDKKPNKPRAPITLLLTSRRFLWWAVVTAILWLYAGVYLWMLERKVYFPTGVDRTTGQNLFAIELQYRIAEGWFKAGMRPAHWIDRYCRGDFWTTIEHSDGRKWKNPKPLANPVSFSDDSST
jgi:hypothetical protein